MDLAHRREPPATKCAGGPFGGSDAEISQAGQLISAQELVDFLHAFAAALLAAGAQTARVDRNAARIARAYGYEVELALFSKHLMLTVARPAKDGAPMERRTAVGSIRSGAPNFQRVAALNSLGWRIVDERPPLRQVRESFDAILAAPPLNPVLLRFLAACANASFCRLFDGDGVAMALVFMATLAGFYLRQILIACGVDIKITFFLCAFASSLLASPGVIFQWGSTPQTALAASVLFLIPGIPLINAMLDILDGHVLMGISRLIQASLLIVCIALGLSLTMLLLGMESL